jgi:hypothetical protein
MRARVPAVWQKSIPGATLSRVRSHAVGVMIALCVCGCASRKEPAVPAPVGGMLNTSAADAPVTDAEYDKMGIAAASRIKFIAPGKTVAMYQTNSKSLTFRGLVAAVIDVYGFREIHPGEAEVACAPRAPRGPRTVAASVPSCGLNVADVLVQFNSVQITRDSGYIGGLLTDVPRGDNKTRTTAFCIVTARHGTDWIGVQNTVVDAPRDCANDRQH